MTLADLTVALETIQQHPEYRANLEWGTPRPGHPEGTVRAHMDELERNLARLADSLTAEETARLRLLIHTHDTFKGAAREGVPITDPQSHASLARAFLARFCDDTDLLNMVQYHDEPYALWQQVRSKGRCNPDRLQALLSCIQDWNLFAAFQLVDNCTAGKDRAPLRWFLPELAHRIEIRWTVDDLARFESVR